MMFVFVTGVIYKDQVWVEIIAILSYSLHEVGFVILRLILTSWVYGICFLLIRSKSKRTIDAIKVHLSRSGMIRLVRVPENYHLNPVGKDANRCNDVVA